MTQLNDRALAEEASRVGRSRDGDDRLVIAYRWLVDLSEAEMLALTGLPL